MVVRPPYLIAVTMSELTLDPILVRTTSIQLGGQQVPESMASLAALIAGQAQGFVDGVLRHRPIGIGAGEYQRVLTSEFKDLSQDFYSLPSKGTTCGR